MDNFQTSGCWINSQDIGKRCEFVISYIQKTQFAYQAKYNQRTEDYLKNINNKWYRKLFRLKPIKSIWEFGALDAAIINCELQENLHLYYRSDDLNTARKLQHMSKFTDKIFVSTNDLWMLHDIEEEAAWRVIEDDAAWHAGIVSPTISDATKLIKLKNNEG